MRLPLITAAIVLGLTTVAQAQSVAECRNVPGPAARLACYDALPVAGGGSFGPQIRPQRSPEAPTDRSFAIAEQAIKNGLPDPEGAKFIGLQQRNDAVCGFVNARGPSGGYTGSKLFVHVISSGETHVLDLPKDAPGAASAQEAYSSHCKSPPQ